MQPIPSSSDRLMREAHRRRLATGSAFFLAMGVMGQVFVPLPAQTGLDAEAAYELEIVSRDPGSELMFDIETGEAIATNGVRVVYGPSRMDADEVRLNQNTGWVAAQGNVLFQNGTNIWVGDTISYNFKDQTIEAADFRTGQSPAYVYGETLEGVTRAGAGGGMIARDAWFTTDDTADPGYYVKAGKFKLVPGQYVEASNATLYYQGIPVFWLPYYRQSLQQDGNRFIFTPGFRSRFGAYLNSSYLWKLNDQVKGQIDLDYRTRRGFALGPKVIYTSPEYGNGTFEYKHFWDKDPEFFSNGRSIGGNRYRLDFSHWWMPKTNLYVRARLGKLSDPFVHADYFEDDFRRDPQPKTFVEIRKFWENYSLGMTLQPRLNTFFEQTERIPEVSLSSYRQELGETGIFYESQSSFGYYQKRFADFSGDDFSAYRADTFHQLLYPQTYFGWLQATPQVGFRLSEYGKADGPGATTTRTSRAMANMGVDFSAKISRTWRGYRNGFWDLNGLRHIMRPSMYYVYVPDPSEDPGRLPQFDSVIPTLRLQPTHFPDINSIDSIEGQHNVRLGLFQKLQTYRDSSMEDFIHWGLFMDWRLDNRPGVSTFSDIYSDLDWRLRDGLTLTSEYRWDTDNQRTRLADHRLIIDPLDDWSWAIGHRYIRNNDLFGEGNNLYSSSLYYWLDDNWSLNATHFFEARASTLQEQIYSIYRDNRSYSTAFRFRVRQPRFTKTDVTLTLEFTLKGFPGSTGTKDKNTPDFLLSDF